MSAAATSISSPGRRPPVEGPAVWFGPGMAAREMEWTYVLTPADLAEIEAALASVLARGLDIAAIRREDFPLPRLGPMLEHLRGEVLDGRGFVRLRGMNVDNRPIRESANAHRVCT